MGEETPREKAERDARQMARKLCKTNRVSVSEVETEGGRKEFAILADGCRNERRHGSKWCQACSDAHRTPAPEQPNAYGSA